MKKKNLKTLKINKKTISNFNTILGGGDYLTNNCDTGQTFCAAAPTCGPGCEAVTKTVQTACCD